MAAQTSWTQTPSLCTHKTQEVSPWHMAELSIHLILVKSGRKLQAHQCLHLSYLDYSLTVVKALAWSPNLSDSTDSRS